MRTNTKKTTTKTISIPLLPLTILFVVLKLFGAITWSWIWVVSPLWLPFAVFLIAFGLISVFTLFVFFFSKRSY